VVSHPDTHGEPVRINTFEIIKADTKTHRVIQVINPENKI
jgi:hypothetical protein